MKEEVGAIKPNSLKSEHLAPGVKPIMACLSSHNDNYNAIERNFTKGQYVNYNDNPSIWDKNNFLHAGLETYVISPVDDSKKFSRGFFDCTGLVIVGVDKKTGKNISFLTHQDPRKFLLLGKKDKFVKNLRQRLTEIQDRCENRTIDAVIVGGKYPKYPGDIYSDDERRNYLSAIELLSLETQQALGFEPIVINGPKTEGHFDDIFFDNENRRLYFVRPKVNPGTGSFTQAGIDKEKEKWK